MRVGGFRRTTVVLALATALCGGVIAAEKRVPKELDPGFSPRDIDTLVVLSVADVRMDDTSEFKDLDKMAHTYLRRGLKKKGLTVEFRHGFGSWEEITGDDLTNREQGWAQALGGGDPRWVLLPVLNITSLAAPYWAECSAYLVDTETGNVVWHDSRAWRRPSTGLIGAALAKSMRNGSVRECFMDVVKTLPGRRKK